MVHSWVLDILNNSDFDKLNEKDTILPLDTE